MFQGGEIELKLERRKLETERCESTAAVRRWAVQAQSRNIGVSSLVLVAGEERRVALSFSSFITPAIAARPVYTYILASRHVIKPSHLSREQSRCKFLATQPRTQSISRNPSQH